MCVVSGAASNFHIAARRIRNGVFNFLRGSILKQWNRRTNIRMERNLLKEVTKFFPSSNSVSCCCVVKRHGRTVNTSVICDPHYSVSCLEYVNIICYALLWSRKAMGSYCDKASLHKAL